MPRVGGTYYQRIDNHPTCASASCRKHAERRGGSIMSAFCRTHTTDEIYRLTTTGLSYGAARAMIWAARPQNRLVFVPPEDAR